jgi:multidrug resistance protein, MATE family
MMLFMMPIWGLSATANTMVSNLLGQDKKEELMKLVKKIILLGLGCVLVFLPVMIINPKWYLFIYTNDLNLVNEGVRSLFVVYFTMFLFVPSVIVLYSLMGTGDTKASFLIEVAATVCYLIFAWSSAIIFKLPLEWVWCAETLYWIVIGSFALLRLKSLKWQKIKL